MLSEAVILAGGLGTRLRPVVSDVPKPLADIAGKPFLCWLLDALGRQGVSSAVLATGYMGDVIFNALGTEYCGISLQYVREEKTLGTGGALWGALGHCRGERVFAMNGDTWLGLDLARLAAEAPMADMTLAARYVPERSRYGGLLIESGRVVGLQGRESPAPPVAVNAGVYAVRADLPQRFPLPEAFSLEDEVLAGAARYDIRAHLVEAEFLDIGTPEDFSRAQTLIPAWTAGH